MNWNLLAEKSCSGEILSEQEARSVLECPDGEILALIDAAYQVRQKYFGRRVKLNFLLNAKSGLCPEDCFYCSQSKISSAPVEKYAFLSEEKILEAAERARKTQARRFCIVNSGRGPTDAEVQQFAKVLPKLKSQYPDLEVCVCLGLLAENQARQLKEAGADAYNHNLNTSESHYGEICTTHDYQNRKDTIACAKEAGLSSCSGCLFGMGESQADRLQLAYEFRKLGVESIPINFLIPIAGTPLENTGKLTPQECLKILCLFRFVNPSTEIRIAGGREHHLRWLQPLGLYVANSIFIGDYLTTKGQTPQADLAMIRDLGFEIEGRPDWHNAPQEFTEDPGAFTVALK